MPHKPHKCANSECDILVKRKDAVHCRKHVVRTLEHNAKIGASQIGRVIGSETRVIQSEKRITYCKNKGLKITPKHCVECGKELTKKKTYYCSSECAYKSRTDKKVANCPQCGKEKVTTNFFIKRGRVFCSSRCSSIYNKSRQKNKGTKIELAMKEQLLINNIEFIEQHPLCNICITDFYLPKNKVAIFCDGNYWHNFPIGKPKDKIQEGVLIENGYTVLRFWESEINGDIQNCLNKIIESQYEKAS